jgi:tRNA threonylcarbamoyl adenosine modification protein (Sua5/YciO/YrdC/YwlC family)
VSTTYPTANDEERETAIEAAARAVQQGGLVILPTDTVYGIGADAFDHAAVQALLDAKGRGREMPPPVLVSAVTTLEALASGVPAYVESLTEEFWPGALTLVCHAHSSLQWDLGDTRGTVAVRMPDHEVAIELLSRTGPLAVSSANKTGLPAATDADAAEAMLGNDVAVILDAGPTPGAEPSTIVDVTAMGGGRLLRQGALSLERLNEVVFSLGVEITGDGSEA